MNLNTSLSNKNSTFSGLIGIGRENITPTIGICNRNWGAAEKEKAEGIHRQLLLTCLTFQDYSREKPLILISVDLGFWYTKVDEWFVRKELLKAFDIDESRLMFCLTHTHAGPNLYRKNRIKPGGDLIKPFLLKLRDSAIKAIKNALLNPYSATLTWHYGKCDLAANRDMVKPNTKKQKSFLVGYNPGGSADETLLVGRITENEKDTIIATIVNYACHPTTLGWDNVLISPDYVGAMREFVEEKTNGAPCLFLQGASGELAPAEQYTDNVQIADKNGFQLGYAVLATLISMLPPATKLAFKGVKESGATLGIWEREKYNPQTSLTAKKIMVSLPLKELLSLVEIDKKLRSCTDRTLKERLWRYRAIRKSIGEDSNVIEVPLWIWDIGNSFLIGQPGEAYSIFQRQIRKSIYPKAAAVMNLVNGSYGYLPPRNLYDKDIYQVWQTPFGANSLELLTKTIVNYFKNSKNNYKLNLF